MESEKKQLITLKEAISLTNENAITIENISNIIRSQASVGANKANFFNAMLPFDVMGKVLEMGFAITQTTGPIGENIITISW